MKKTFATICLFLTFFIFTFSCSFTSPYMQKEPAKGVYHRVKKGETFWSIANAYHVKVQDLAEINNIKNPGMIEEGSVIFIPDANQVIDDIMNSIKSAGAEPGSSSKAAGAVKTKTAAEDNDVKAAKSAVQESKSSDKKVIPPPTATAEKTKIAKATPREEAVDAAAAKKPAAEKIERKPKSAGEEKEEIQFERKRFIWPVRGSVKTRFGIQNNKTYHNWIKIVSSSGMQVKAAANGTVIFSSPLKDYGETIIVRHEDGFATVYTHLKKRHVKTDQNVKKGDVIALVGELDEAGDAYMNFEVRLHGKARNPLFFLP